jgi:hypothetical protein
MRKKDLEYKKNKPYLYMKPLVIPSSLFLGFILIFFAGKVNESMWFLILFIVSWFITGEFRIFKEVASYRLYSIGYYSVIGVLCALGGYLHSVFLIITSYLPVLLWAYYSSLVYSKIFLSSNDNIISPDE